MTKYDWLLVLHILAAFAFLSGVLAAVTLQGLAMRRQKPSEVALLLGLVQPVVAVIGIGAILALGFGIWLTQEDPNGIALSDGWVIAAIVLWAISAALSGPAGKRVRHARELAETLAAEGDQPSDALRAAVRDRTALILHTISFLALLAILVLMVFKPGAG